MAILTFDAGTSGLKCSLFSKTGELLGACVGEYPTLYPGEGMAEQRCADIIAALINAINRLKEIVALDQTDAIGLTGTMNGCILLDKAGQPLNNNIIHLDTRSSKQVERLNAELGSKEYYARTGNRPDVHYGLPKLMWLKDNAPDVYAMAECAVNTKDLIYGFLTGDCFVTDYSDASLFGMLNISTKRWDTDIAAAAGIDAYKLPELRASYNVCRTLNDKAAKLLGLKSGIPVAVGAGDGPATTHGSGIYDDSSAYLTVGSSAWTAALSQKPCFDESMRAFNYIDMDDSRVTVCGTVQCAATALDYMLKTVLNVTDANGNIDFAEAEKLCRESAPGANGVVFLPTLMGERCPWWDPKARGVLTGLTLTHTRADMVRAVYEGIAQSLNNCVDVIRENGIPIDRLTLTGGGVKSGVWPQMFADMFGAETRVHLNPREATSLGAAIAAGVGAGIYKSFKEAAQAVKTSRAYIPNIKAHKKYVKHTAYYRPMYSNLANAMHASSDYK